MLCDLLIASTLAKVSIGDKCATKKCPYGDHTRTKDEGEDKSTVIMDAGIATEENLAALRERGFH